MKIEGQKHDIFNEILREREREKEIGTHRLLTCIYLWEKESINKMQQVAKQARTDLNSLVDLTKQTLRFTMSRLINELQSNRESEDYVELDLKK